ncbi:50S ribosomal protein L21 [Candidatus Kaiserbacteria bacterium]|nr:MAG: 50S ribosomal protein L21 [Candidatus Kaiserbacteria bacterium]
MAEKKVTEKKTPAKKAAVKKAPAKKESGFAVIATGGKQYIVREGDFLNLELLEGEKKEGAKIEFEEVLLTDNGKETKVGEPTVKGAKVMAEFIQEGRDKKISVIRFRSKSRYFKNKGHRQPYTRVKITKV